MDVKVTVAMNRKIVAASEVRDPRVSTALVQAGRDLGTKLENIACPDHGKRAWNVRLHFAANGAGDLKYESCCERLGQEIGKALG